MSDSLPRDFKDVENETIVGEDNRSLSLTHYVLAERLMQVEYDLIKREILEQPNSDTLIYILEGGLRGYHKQTAGELWAEWKDGAEDKWYAMYEDDTLPWEPFEDDPIHTLEDDENGEVSTYGKRLTDAFGHE